MKKLFMVQIIPYLLSSARSYLLTDVMARFQASLESLWTEGAWEACGNLFHSLCDSGGGKNWKRSHAWRKRSSGV